MTQKERLHDHLKRRSINPLQAWTELGIYRLAARVHDLKADGVPVNSTIVKVENRYGESFSVAQYSLEPQQRELI